MWQPRTLLITDPNLGQEAHRLVLKHCRDLTWVSWDINRPEDRSRVLAQLGGSCWDLAISFYSDLILPPVVLEQIKLPLNIHPALPRIRGVGHDTVPLAERHSSVGATLHRMERLIDAGMIFKVMETPLTCESTYESLRTLNQSNSLIMLDWFCELLAGSADLTRLEYELSENAKSVSHVWGTYYSRRTVKNLLERLALLPAGYPL